MVQVKIVTNTSRKTIGTNDTSTVREVLDQNNVNYRNTPVYLDGAPLSAGDYNKSLAELGVTDKCDLTVVIKTENA